MKVLYDFTNSNLIFKENREYFKPTPAKKPIRFLIKVVKTSDNRYTIKVLDRVHDRIIFKSNTGKSKLKSRWENTLKFYTYGFEKTVKVKTINEELVYN